MRLEVTIRLEQIRIFGANTVVRLSISLAGSPTLRIGFPRWVYGRNQGVRVPRLRDDARRRRALTCT